MKTLEALNDRSALAVVPLGKDSSIAPSTSVEVTVPDALAPALSPSIVPLPGAAGLAGSAPAAAGAAAAAEEDTNAAVPADPRRGSCCICGEQFERTYDDAHDQWVYRGATMLPTGNYAHTRCRRLQASH